MNGLCFQERKIKRKSIKFASQSQTSEEGLFRETYVWCPFESILIFTKLQQVEFAREKLNRALESWWLEIHRVLSFL